MKQLYTQTLYKRHSTGQIGSWIIEVTGYDTGEAIIQRSARKVLDGQPVITSTPITKGKNIGRSNETTPWEQAVMDAESKVRKQLDKGYVLDLEDAQVKSTNNLGFIKPMLAQPVEKVKDWDFPVMVQPKMDGHRMLATVKDGQVVLYSRQGKTLDVEHIRSVLQKAFDEGIWCGTTLDGEVYEHGQTLQRISSLVKKPKPESRNLVYNLYDIVKPVCYSDRMEDLLEIADNVPFDIVYVTDTMKTTSQDELDAIHGEFIGMGYEGTIIRQLGMPYEDDKRSKSLMKKKDFQDAEFEIIGVTKGKPNLRHNLEVGIYQCKTPDNNAFTVTAPGDMHEKHRHAIEGHANVGKLLTVKFFNHTPDGIPFHPVALRVREDI